MLIQVTDTVDSDKYVNVVFDRVNRGNTNLVAEVTPTFLIVNGGNASVVFQ